MIVCLMGKISWIIGKLVQVGFFGKDCFWYEGDFLQQSFLEVWWEMLGFGGSVKGELKILVYVYFECDVFVLFYIEFVLVMNVDG